MTERTLWLSLPADNQPFVLGAALAQATDCLKTSGVEFGHGTGRAEDEAAWLLAVACNSSPLDAPDVNRPLSPAEVQAVNQLLSSRINARVPLAYLSGTTWFAGLPFKTDARALVPRSPIAEFIARDCFGLLPDTASPRFLDLCTGGGCIGIALAMHYPDSHVVASDLSPDALSLATDNVDLHGAGDRVQLLEGSLFEPVSGQFDLIVSNPPYVDQQDMSALAPEFHHEPALGLAAGADGLDLVRHMLADAAAYLDDDAWLVVEVGNSAAALEAAYPMLDFRWLDFEYGGDGVFALPREELQAQAAALDARRQPLA